MACATSRRRRSVAERGRRPWLSNSWTWIWMNATACGNCCWSWADCRWLRRSRIAPGDAGAWRSSGTRSGANGFFFHDGDTPFPPVLPLRAPVRSVRGSNRPIGGLTAGTQWTGCTIAANSAWPYGTSEGSPIEGRKRRRMKADPQRGAGRAFVRSLNILLKFARLYGYEHARTIEQLQIAWQELRSAIPLGTDGGLLLGATNSQLLLDGVPLEGSPAEKQFAQLLSAAGLASIQFFASITEDEISRFARAFPTGKSKPAELALQLKAALAGAQGIRINEICFVATDSRLKEASMAAQIAAASLGGEQDEFKKWLNDPQKLLELIAAAQGSKAGGVAGTGPGGPMPAGADSATGTGLPSGSGEVGSAGDASGRSGCAGTGVGPSYGAGTSGLGGGIGVGGGGTGHVAGPVGSFWASGGNGSVQVSDVVAGLRGAGGVAGALGGGSGPGRGGSGRGEPSEEEIYAILGALTSFGSVGTSQGGVAAAGAFQQEMTELPGRAQDMLKQALASLAAQAPNAKPDESVIVQLAEHLAIRFALERFERGEVKVNAVRQMLDRMNQEIENLRKILGAHEDKMSEAGILSESHREILDRQFWAAVPESGKRAVLHSGAQRAVLRSRADRAR